MNDCRHVQQLISTALAPKTCVVLLILMPASCDAQRISKVALQQG